MDSEGSGGGIVLDSSTILISSSKSSIKKAAFAAIRSENNDFEDLATELFSSRTLLKFPRPSAYRLSITNKSHSTFSKIPAAREVISSPFIFTDNSSSVPNAMAEKALVSSFPASPISKYLLIRSISFKTPSTSDPQSNWRTCRAISSLALLVSPISSSSFMAATRRPVLILTSIVFDFISLVRTESFLSSSLIAFRISSLISKASPSFPTFLTNIPSAASLSKL